MSAGGPSLSESGWHGILNVRYTRKGAVALAWLRRIVVESMQVGNLRFHRPLLVTVNHPRMAEGLVEWLREEVSVFCEELGLPAAGTAILVGRIKLLNQEDQRKGWGLGGKDGTEAEAEAEADADADADAGWGPETIGECLLNPRKFACHFSLL